MTQRLVVAGVLAVLGAGLMPAEPSRAADVHIGIDIGTPPPPPIVLAEPPRLALVPRLPVYYAPSLPYNFFYYDGRYFTYDDGGWSWAVSSRGPWIAIELGRVPQPILSVPVAYYKAPPGHWKKHRQGPPPWASHGRKHKHKKHDH